ncbi:MAG: hypothetical protein GF313_16375 [Caldithrix sp.]|nr:hypothetical protein [Caldithrix sp.]
MSSMENIKKSERKAIGILLGTAVGDILGAPVEGYSRDQLIGQFGELNDFLPSGRGYGNYTDDTEMTLALAESIVDQNGVDARDCALKYARFYSPWRGYGAGTHKVLHALRQGEDYTKTGRLVFSDGSFGNGGAMRIAPVGYIHRNSKRTEMRRAVTDALLCTHVHPIGIDGAVIQARMIGILANLKGAGDVDPVEICATLRKEAADKIIVQKIDIIEKLIIRRDPDDAAILNLGNGINASEAVSCSIFATLKYFEDPENAVIKSVMLGGDTDTIGAMCGAHMGALYGFDWLPDRWLNNIENYFHGRDYILHLGKGLAQVEQASSKK